MPKQVIRIRLKAFDHKVLDASAVKIVDSAVRTGASVSGPVTIANRAPFIHSTTLYFQK